MGACGIIKTFLENSFEVEETKKPSILIPFYKF